MRFAIGRLAISLALATLSALSPAAPARAGLIVDDPSASARPPHPPPFPAVEVTARSAVVVDDATGQVVFEKHAHDRRAPASITKIVTALVAIERDHPDRVVSANVDWWELRDSTLMGLYRGSRVSIEDLLYGLMLPSGNDAAVALARAVGGGEAQFVAMMNAEAARLGLRDTHFANPHGLDQEGHYTSAYDITMLARYAMRNPEFAKVVGTRAIEVVSVGGRAFDLRNINRFPAYYPGGDGVKHGYTDDAGQTLVATAVRNGRRAYVGLMGSWNYTGDAAALMDAYFQTYASQRVAVAPRDGLGAPSADPAAMPPHKWVEDAPSRTGLVPPSMRVQ